jgi:hypothetical protein
LRILPGTVSILGFAGCERMNHCLGHNGHVLVCVRCQRVHDNLGVFITVFCPMLSGRSR